MRDTRLRVELRQKQLYRDLDPSQPIIVQCNADGSAEYLDGTVPSPDWIDFTPDVDGLDKFTVSWQAETTNYSKGASETTNSFGSNYSKAVSAELVFYGDAFKFIYGWLMESVCGFLNCIEVRITDLEALKSYRVFELKIDNVGYRPYDEPCIVTIPLREGDEQIHAVNKTILEDDWQGWFNREGTGSKDFPTFMYVVEKKPKFMLVILMVIAYIAGILSIGILKDTSDGKIWIRRMLGVCFFCPSPRIIDYIMNFCMKYGFTWNTIFDDVPENPYRDLCLFFPVERSIPELENWNSVSTKFMWENRTGKPMNVALDEWKNVFNAEWYITPNKELIFQNVAFFDSRALIYDFSANVNDFYDFQYTFTGNKKPAYGNYQFQLDPQDSDSNELKWRYCDIVDFDGDANNPMLEGNVTRNFEYAPTAFMYDGSKPDFIEESIGVARIIGSAAVIAGMSAILLSIPLAFGAIGLALLTAGYFRFDSYMSDFFQSDNIRGAIRTASNEINVPRLLLWDRTTELSRAKVVSVENPVINPYYNVNNIDYYAEHHALDEPGFAEGVTAVYNYPAYLDANYFGNLYDRFHEVDNPLKTPDINQKFSMKVRLCADMMNILGFFEGQFAQIGANIGLEKRGTRLVTGRITNIEANYDEGYIEITGKVLK